MARLREAQAFTVGSLHHLTHAIASYCTCMIYLRLYLVTKPIPSLPLLNATRNTSAILWGTSWRFKSKSQNSFNLTSTDLPTVDVFEISLICKR